MYTIHRSFVGEGRRIAKIEGVPADLREAVSKIKPLLTQAALAVFTPHELVQININQEHLLDEVVVAMCEYEPPTG